MGILDLALCRKTSKILMVGSQHVGFRIAIGMISCVMRSRTQGYLMITALGGRDALIPSNLAEQFEMANKKLTEYTRRKAKQVAEEFTEEVEEVHRKCSIEPIPVTLLTWVMNFLTDLNIEFKLVTSEKMIKEAKNVMGKQAKLPRKRSRRTKKLQETDVT